MKKISVVIALLLAANCGLAADLNVTAVVKKFGKLGEDSLHEGKHAFVVRAILENRSGKPLTVSFMDFGFYTSWRIQSGSIFEIAEWPTFKNKLTTRELAPGGSLVFELPIVAVRQPTLSRYLPVRIGFVVKDVASDFFAVVDPSPEGSIVWSNELLVSPLQLFLADEEMSSYGRIIEAPESITASVGH